MAFLKLPRSANSVTVLRWLVKPGESFSGGVPLVELEAEQAVLTVSVPEAGVLIRSMVKPGQTVTTGGELAQVEWNSTTSTVPAPKSPTPKSIEEQKVADDSTSADSDEVVPILMPQAGNTMEEGTVLEWRVQEGDTIELGQILCEIETDKATMEFESPAAGRLARIVATESEPIAVKELIAVVASSDATADAYLASAGTSSVATETAAPEVVARSAPSTNHVSSAPAAYSTSGRIKASPAARKIAVEQGVMLETVGRGSGPEGRILSSDLSGAKTVPALSRGVTATQGERRPISKMRRAIGANLQRSKQTVPHFYMRVTINAASLQDFYHEQKPQTNCSLNDLVILAVGRAMRDFPEVRSQIDGGDIVEFPHANIGIAVGVDDGLVVPVVLSVDTLSLTEIAQESRRVIEAGRKGVLENVGKANFTISNLGMFGIEEFSAIINPPESGILAISAVRETVIVKNGSLSPGRVMTMTLSADHRVIDGLLAAKFVGRLQEILENPAIELS